ncbi:MAG: hypothetical protein SWI22_12910 [Pseudomonadota bacterium]|nr:hypothetical protein [Pseudomonadota bacterium]
MPELQMGPSFGFWNAFATLASIVAMVLFTNHIRRGLGGVFTLKTIGSFIGVAAAIALLIYPEISAFASSNTPASSTPIPPSIILKSLIVIYLLSWSVISYLDQQELSA